MKIDKVKDRNMWRGEDPVKGITVVIERDALGRYIWTWANARGKARVGQEFELQAAKTACLFSISEGS